MEIELKGAMGPDEAGSWSGWTDGRADDGAGPTILTKKCNPGLCPSGFRLPTRGEG